MSKRLNPHRRLLQAQSKLLREVMAEFGPAHDDSHKLQRGVVRSGLAVKTQLSHYSAPRDNWEGTGSKVRKPVKRFGVLK